MFEEKFSHKRFFNRKISLEIIVKKRGNIQQNKTKEIDVFLWINLETQRNRVDREKKNTLHSALDTLYAVFCAKLFTTQGLMCLWWFGVWEGERGVKKSETASRMLEFTEI